MAWMWDEGKEGTWKSPPPSCKPSSSHNRAALLDAFFKDSAERMLRRYRICYVGWHRTGREGSWGKFLARLWEALCKFTDIAPKSAEEEWSKKTDFSHSKLQISAISYENTCLDQVNLKTTTTTKLLQLAQMVYYGKECEEENEQNGTRR